VLFVLLADANHIAVLFNRRVRHDCAGLFFAAITTDMDLAVNADLADGTAGEMDIA
jgi:hypothetical protein